MAPTTAVRLLHQLRLMPQVFTPPQQLVAVLGGEFGAPCVETMAAAEALVGALDLQVRAVCSNPGCALKAGQGARPGAVVVRPACRMWPTDPSTTSTTTSTTTPPTRTQLSVEERRMLLLAALLLPLRRLTYPGKGTKQAPASAYVIRESLKWRGKDVDVVGLLHTHAAELAAVHAQLQDSNGALTSVLLLLVAVAVVTACLCRCDGSPHALTAADEPAAAAAATLSCRCCKRGRVRCDRRARAAGQDDPAAQGPLEAGGGAGAAAVAAGSCPPGCGARL